MQIATFTPTVRQTTACVTRASKVRERKATVSLLEVSYESAQKCLKCLYRISSNKLLASNNPPPLLTNPQSET